MPNNGPTQETLRDAIRLKLQGSRVIYVPCLDDHPFHAASRQLLADSRLVRNRYASCRRHGIPTR